MAKKPQVKNDPIELEEPNHNETPPIKDRKIWMRGLWMLVLAFMFGLAQTILAASAVVQFLWMLFSGEKNALLVDFGRGMGKWLNDVALFQTGGTEDKPFPWDKWG